MAFATLRRYALLALLIFFVAYFGVWQLYVVMAPALGGIWAGVLTALAGLGLGVIALVGVIMVHTKGLSETADFSRKEVK